MFGIPFSFQNIAFSGPDINMLPRKDLAFPNDEPENQITLSSMVNIAVVNCDPEKVEDALKSIFVIPECSTRVLLYVENPQEAPIVDIEKLHYFCQQNMTELQIVASLDSSKHWREVLKPLFEKANAKKQQISFFASFRCTACGMLRIDCEATQGIKGCECEDPVLATKVRWTSKLPSLMLQKLEKYQHSLCKLHSLLPKRFVCLDKTCTRSDRWLHCDQCLATFHLDCGPVMTFENLFLRTKIVTPESLEITKKGLAELKLQVLEMPFFDKIFERSQQDLFLFCPDVYADNPSAFQLDMTKKGIVEVRSHLCTMISNSFAKIIKSAMKNEFQTIADCLKWGARLSALVGKQVHVTSAVDQFSSVKEEPKPNFMKEVSSELPGGPENEDLHSENDIKIENQEAEHIDTEGTAVDTRCIKSVLLAERDSLITQKNFKSNEKLSATMPGSQKQTISKKQPPKLSTEQNINESTSQLLRSSSISKDAKVQKIEAETSQFLAMNKRKLAEIYRRAQRLSQSIQPKKVRQVTQKNTPFRCTAVPFENTIKIAVIIDLKTPNLTSNFRNTRKNYSDKSFQIRMLKGINPKRYYFRMKYDCVIVNTCDFYYDQFKEFILNQMNNGAHIIFAGKCNKFKHLLLPEIEGPWTTTLLDNRFMDYDFNQNAAEVLGWKRSNFKVEPENWQRCVPTLKEDQFCETICTWADGVPMISIKYLQECLITSVGYSVDPSSSIDFISLLLKLARLKRIW